MPASDTRGESNSSQRLVWWSSPRMLLRYLIAIDDTPHHIALGAAIGMFVGITPTPGIQMLLVAVLHRIFRPLFYFNLPSGLVATYGSNPVTALPIAWASYSIGRLFVGGDLSRDDLAELLDNEGVADWGRSFVSLVVDLGWAYLIGSFVLAAILAGVTYLLVIALVRLCRDESAQRV